MTKAEHSSNAVDENISLNKSIPSSFSFSKALVSLSVEWAWFICWNAFNSIHQVNIIWFIAGRPPTTPNGNQSIQLPTFIGTTQYVRRTSFLIKRLLNNNITFDYKWSTHLFNDFFNFHAPHTHTHTNDQYFYWQRSTTSDVRCTISGFIYLRFLSI